MRQRVRDLEKKKKIIKYEQQLWEKTCKNL